MAGELILIIEDETTIVRLLRLYLEQAGYRVLAANDGITGLETHARERPNLVILDLMLPGLDGLEVCRRIRAWAKTPIVMLTARQSEDDRVQGLELGADDYIAKPFSTREVVSRVRAVLRRSQGDAGGDASRVASATHGSAAGVNGSVLRFPGLVVTIPARRVEVDGKSVDLTPKEFDMLALMAGSPDRVFTRDVLLSQVWGYDYLGDGRTVDVHIGTLRKKIERDASNPRYIKTVWRVGYKFQVPTS
ncbi:MAG TPA: response regulator transcription factor [Ktedonobacterales bacterium]|jgi:two-component system response regulator ResD